MNNLLLGQVLTLLRDKWEWPKFFGEKKAGAYSSSSRNYDQTMQFCNTSLRQQGQRSVALNRYMKIAVYINFQGTLQMGQKVIIRFWWESGLSSASRNNLTTFCRPFVHYACLKSVPR